MFRLWDSHVVKQVQDHLELESKETAQRVLYNCCLFICLIFCSTTISGCKDAICVSVGKGTGLLNFLRSFMIFLSFGTLGLFEALNKHYKKSEVFEIVMLSFTAFFLFYAYVLGPNREFFHIAPATEATVTRFLNQSSFVGPVLASFFKNFVVNWTSSLFYCAADVFGSLCIAQLFWGFIVTTTSDPTAQKTFPVYQGMSGFGSIFVSLVAMLIVKTQVTGMQTNMALWDQNLQNITWSMVIAVLAALLFRRWSNAITIQATGPEKGPTQKPQSSLSGVFDSIQFVFKSRELRFIALVIIAYSMSTTLFENVIKNNIGKVAHFNTTSSYVITSKSVGFQGLVQIIICLSTYGLVSIAKWGQLAIVTPIVLVLGGGCFFSVSIMPSVAESVTSFVNQGRPTHVIDVSTLVTNLGLCQDVLLKACTYAFLNVARERGYLRLNEEQKTRGKPVVDMLGNRLGKAAAGFSISTILTCSLGGGDHLSSCQQTDNITPHTAVLYGICALTMLFAILRLSSIYKKQDEASHAIAVKSALPSTNEAVKNKALMSKEAYAHSVVKNLPSAFSNISMLCSVMQYNREQTSLDKFLHNSEGNVTIEIPIRNKDFCEGNRTS